MDRAARIILDEVGLGESPRWHENRLWFADWLDGDVISVEPDGTGRVVHAHLDGFPICFDWLPSGSLVIVDGPGCRVLRQDGAATTTYADLRAVSDRPWNEVVTHPSGMLYVNGIGFDMMAGETPAMGQIAVIDHHGIPRRVADGLSFPNGMAISADGATLVVAESHAQRLTAYTIKANGDLADRQTWAGLPGAAPDGIAFAPDGTIWYADVPNQHCRRVAAGGDIIDTVQTDRGCFSCALSTDGTLFITAATWNEHTFSSRGGVVLAATSAT
jgi:sugar lactone lactonase YvrE